MTSPLRIAWDIWRTAHSDSVTVVTQQKARLNDLFSFARANSHYYAKLFHDLPATLTDVSQLPPVTKQELMAHFDEWVTDPLVTQTAVDSFVVDPALVGHLFLGRYLVFCTSGSTGTPALILHDLDAWLTYSTLTYLRSPTIRVMAGNLSQLITRGLRSAYIFATGGHFAGAALMRYRLLRHPSRNRTERLFSVLDPLPELVEKLNAYQPTLLTGYASILSTLAQEQQDGRLHIHPILVSSGSEILDHDMRQRIAQAFGCPIFETYSASEGPAITFECPYHQLHVNSDWHILEPVDKFYQIVPTGQPSYSLLITNLANRVQPLIRYELGDSVTILDEPCRCGSPFPVIHVEGRSNDILNFPSVSGTTVPVMPLSLVSVVEKISGIYSFQIIQTELTHLKIRIQARTPGDEPQIWPEVRQRLDSYFASLGITDVTLEREAEMPMRHPHSGKLRQVWTEVKPLVKE